jgi:TnpA family transposase
MDSAARSCSPAEPGQEDQVGALGLVLIAVVAWITASIDLAVNALRGQSCPVRAKDAARLSQPG